MAERNSEVAEDRRIRYRIGINLGDVVAEGDDLSSAMASMWRQGSRVSPILAASV